MEFRKVTPTTINFLKSAGIAEQAKLYIKLTKLHRIASQNVWFNQQCKQLKVIPNYINLRSNTLSRSGSIAINKAKLIWLNEECRYWFTVRDNLKLHIKVLYTELSYNLHNVEFDILDNKARDLASKVVHQKYLTQCRKLQRLTRDSSGNSTSLPPSHTFYPRVKNLSNSQFTTSQLTLLEKGLKYNLNQELSQKSLETLVVDSEVACHLGKKNDAVKLQISVQLQNHTPSHSPTNDIYLYKSLQDKINHENLVLSKADKGNSIVIMNRNEYEQKVNDIIQGEEFETLNSDPTKKFTQKIKNIIKITTFISPEVLKHIVPMNPRSPLLYGLPKIHKENIPMRPVVSYIGAPAYNLAKFLNNYIKIKSSFNPQYSLSNSLDLINKIKNVHIPPNSKLISLDVESLFTNVPYHECLILLEQQFERQRLLPGEINDIINLTKLSMEQNYFRFNNTYYRQKEGLAMGSPLSPLMAEVFMDNFECKYIVNEPHILFYYRYVDDIIILWTGTLRQIDIFVSKLNNIHPKIKFKLEVESNQSLNFLDLTISKSQNKLDFQIYRKPTHTDIAIPSTSLHPLQHKLAAFRSYVHRLLSIPLSKDNYNKELRTIYQIAVTNGYDEKMVDNLIIKKQRKVVRSLLYAHPPDKINKYVSSLTYIGPLSYKISNILRKHGVHVAFRTNQTVRRLCNGKDRLENSKKSGVYSLVCDECNGIYIGQTGRNFNTRYKEHVAAYRNGYPEKSHFAKHLIDSGHSLRDNNNYNILHVCDKGLRLSVLEQLEIVKNNIPTNTLLNEQTNIIPSPLLRSISINRLVGHNST